MKMARPAVSPSLNRPGGRSKIRGCWKPQAPERWPRGYRRPAWARGPGDIAYRGPEFSPRRPTCSLTRLTPGIATLSRHGPLGPQRATPVGTQLQPEITISKGCEHWGPAKL